MFPSLSKPSGLEQELGKENRKHLRAFFSSARWKLFRLSSPGMHGSMDQKAEYNGFSYSQGNRVVDPVWRITNNMLNLMQCFSPSTVSWLQNCGILSEINKRYHIKMNQIYHIKMNQRYHIITKLGWLETFKSPAAELWREATNFHCSLLKIFHFSLLKIFHTEVKATSMLQAPLHNLLGTYGFWGKK